MNLPIHEFLNSGVRVTGLFERVVEEVTFFFFFITHLPYLPHLRESLQTQCKPFPT